MVALVRLLHVLIHTGKTFFILGHALSKVLFYLLLLLEYSVVVYLLYCFPFFFHLLLDVDYEAVLIPNTVLVLGLD